MLFTWLKPHKELGEDEIRKGLNGLVWDGVLSQIMTNLTTGAFLVAFALLLGASNAVIGILSAMAPLTQALQLPTIYVVEKTRNRRALTVGSSLFARLFWVVVAGIPFIMPAPYRLPCVVVSVSAYYVFGSITSCAFRSWMRDLIPDEILGRFLAKRMSFSMAIAVALGLLGAIGIDVYKSLHEDETVAYSILFSIGALAGLIGVVNLARIPEPTMPPTDGRTLRDMLYEPFHDANFRQLLIYLGAWSFAVNFSMPFFTVYLLARLEMSMTIVLGLTVLSQVMNVLFFRIWGRLADRYSNKSVLAVCGPIYLLSVILWPFTTLPDIHRLTFPLLVLIHVLAGIATAGVTICTSGIALKTAPRGRATSYLATNSLISGAAATLAPIIAGLAADGFETQELGVTLHWVSDLGDHREALFPALNLRGLDFLFIASFVFGLYALHRLISVKEVGDVKEEVVRNEFYGELRRFVRSVSTVAGLRGVTYFPYMRLHERIKRMRSGPSNKNDKE